MTERHITDGKFNRTASPCRRCCRRVYLPFSYRTPYALDFDMMNKAAEILMEYEDFGAFCKSNSDAKTTICHVTAARWHQVSETSWYFEITANRFLRNMVRAVVGTLVDVGRGRLTLDGFRRVIEEGKRTGAGESMPGNALFLEKIEYWFIRRFEVLLCEWPFLLCQYHHRCYMLPVSKCSFANWQHIL